MQGVKQLANKQTLVSWMQAASWLNLVLGVVIFLAPLATGETALTTGTAMLAGLVIFVLALIEERSESTGRPARVLGTSIVNVLVGIGLMAWPFAVATSTAFLATSLTVGIALAVAEVFNLFAASSLRGSAPATT